MTTPTPLERARALDLPEREAMLRRDSSVQRFWAENRDLFEQAWQEWGQGEEQPGLDSSLIDPSLRTAVEAAWDDPSQEAAVRELLHEAAPGVYSFQLFDTRQLARLRDYLERVWDAGIPIRPPYGIVLNRGGGMLDQRSDGYLGAPGFQAFYRMMLDLYMRPISRLVFPEVMGFDSQTFGFSITYQPDTDTSIRPHSDASAVTLNINLNLPGEDYTGSTVDFLDQVSGEVSALRFEPGTAMIHRGHVPHTAHPITTGERSNLVLWLFGEGGRVPSGPSAAEPVEASQRWTVPDAPQDRYAPF